MLTERRSALLNLIVEEYVDTALPVGSEYIVRKHAMPCLVRHGAPGDGAPRGRGLHQPASHLGRPRPVRQGLPLLRREPDGGRALPLEERETIRHQFHQAERAMEQWFQLAAAVLAHSVSNFAVVTSPRSKETRLRHVQLVPLQETSALCVVVLNEARIRQQVISFREPVDRSGR